MLDIDIIISMVVLNTPVSKNGIDNQRFVYPIDNSYFVLEGNDQIPHVVINVNSNTLALGGWEFNITRTVYNTANIGQIFDGWNSLVAEKIPICR